jgi:integrase
VKNTVGENRLTDAHIRAWIRAGERFEGRADGGGLYLRYRAADSVPVWRFRYRFGSVPRVVILGDYGNLSLSDARKEARRMAAQVVLGIDPAGEKKERKRTALAKIEADRLRITVGQLADDYFERMVLGRWKHPNIVRSRIEKDIKPNIGRLFVEDVKPAHIDAMLQAVLKRGAPTVANDVLRWVRRVFDYAVKRHMVPYNPAAAFGLNDAGGKEEARDRALSRDELVALFDAMRRAQGFSVENFHTVKLLLLLAVRKGELIAAPLSEFNLDGGVWSLPAERTKTGVAVDIPLSPAAVVSLRELIRLGCGSTWLLPARKAQSRMLPHIHENTLNVALSKVKKLLPDLESFTVHDFRRTARTHLAAIGVEPHIAERCLNHKIKGVEGVYNRHDYFEERRKALQLWASFLLACESGQEWAPADGKVVPLRGRAG